MSQVLNTLDLITQFLLVAFRGILSHPPFLGTRIPSPNPLRTSPPPPSGGNIPQIPWIQRIEGACRSSFQASAADLHYDRYDFRS